LKRRFKAAACFSSASANPGSFQTSRASRAPRIFASYAYPCSSHVARGNPDGRAFTAYDEPVLLELRSGRAGELLNKISPLGIEAVRAKVYKEASWFDEQETIVLDYSDTSIVAQWIRDEIREVSPGVYLGLVFWERSKLLHFALDFNTT
jgi:hypothetical protein